MAATPLDTAPSGMTAQDLADVLNDLEGTSCHPWATGFVLVQGVSLAIDQEASDALAAEVLDCSSEQGRTHNESHSDFMVAGGLRVRRIDGIGWVPVERPVIDIEDLRRRLPAIRRGEESLRPGELEALIEAAAAGQQRPPKQERMRPFEIGFLVAIQHRGVDAVDAQHRAEDAAGLWEGREIVSDLPESRGGRTAGLIRRVTVLYRYGLQDDDGRPATTQV